MILSIEYTDTLTTEIHSRGETIRANVMICISILVEVIIKLMLSLHNSIFAFPILQCYLSGSYDAKLSIAIVLSLTRTQPYRHHHPPPTLLSDLWPFTNYVKVVYVCQLSCKFSLTSEVPFDVK